MLPVFNDKIKGYLVGYFLFFHFIILYLRLLDYIVRDS